VARTAVFVDTAYLLALVNSRDQWHAASIRWEQALAKLRRPLMTTDFVLIEVGDALSRRQFRQHAGQLIQQLRKSSHVQVISANAAMIEGALKLFVARPDKDWGLTDCASFVVMQEHGLHEALTSDDHFRQAGFRVLLETDPE